MGTYKTASPGPLEIISPKPACDIDHLADEEKTRHCAGRQGPAVQPVCVHAPQGDLGRPITL